MKKALMYASVASMIQQFNMENIRILLELGYQVDVACNMEFGSTITSEKIAEMQAELEAMGVRVFHVPVPRKITALRQILNAYQVTKALLKDQKYDLIHCHSPIGGMICRLANRFCGRYGQARMIYTAHGFHFFKGAPKKNWLMFYPMEKICARYTDLLITINQEDYALANKKMKAKNIAYVPGVGIDTKQFREQETNPAQKRSELGVPDDAKLLFSVGELNQNKNHETVIRAIADIDVFYIIAGKGTSQEHLQQVIDELQLSDRVKLLGFRKDIGELCKAADIFVCPSFREGLSVALMEAMACGMPVAASRIRGNTDLVDEAGGELFDPHSVESCKKSISALLERNLQAAGKHNMQRIENYDLNKVNVIMENLYRCK